MHQSYKVIPLCLLLISCSLLPKPTGTVDKYILTKPTISAQNISKNHSEKEILVVQPTLSVALQDHNRIVYYPTPQKIEYLAGGEWAQKLDLMVWESVFEAFKASHKFKSVFSDVASNGASDCLTLKTHIAVFGIEQEGKDEKAHVVYEFSLFGKDNTLISQKTIEHVLVVKNIKLDAVVFDLNSLHQKTIADYVKQL